MLGQDCSERMAIGFWRFFPPQMGLASIQLRVRELVSQANRL